MSNLTSPRFETPTSRSRDKRVTARPIILLIAYHIHPSKNEAYIKTHNSDDCNILLCYFYFGRLKPLKLYDRNETTFITRNLTSLLRWIYKIALNLKFNHVCLKLSSSEKLFNKIVFKGGESSSQFQWFTIAKIQLYFLIFFILILGLRLQKYSTNTKRCPPEKSFWKLWVLFFPPKPQEAWWFRDLW